ncbi:HGGxSTG domain-containing protein [Bradyrhizobium sp. UFLA06-06]
MEGGGSAIVGKRHPACERGRVGPRAGIRDAGTEARRRPPTACCRRWQAGRTGMSAHRHTGPMPASPRCGAKTRCGGSCRAPAVHGKTRCRMHGGAKGSGATGQPERARGRPFTGDAIGERRQVRALLEEVRKLLKGMKRLVTGTFRQLALNG